AFAGRIQLKPDLVFVGTLADPIFIAVDEVVLEQATEDDLLDEFEARDYTRDGLMFIGDASSQWQSAKHESSKPDSFKIFKSRRWHMLPPQKKKSERGAWSCNPRVSVRLSRVLGMMQAGRALIAAVRHGDQL